MNIVPSIIPEPSILSSTNQRNAAINAKKNIQTLKTYAKKSMNEYYMGKKTENFVASRQRLSYEPKDYLDIKPTIDFRQMDTVQQFFLLSATSLGLYLLFQGLYKRR